MALYTVVGKATGGLNREMYSADRAFIGSVGLNCQFAYVYERLHCRLYNAMQPTIQGRPKTRLLHEATTFDCSHVQNA